VFSREREPTRYIYRQRRDSIWKMVLMIMDVKNFHLLQAGEPGGAADIMPWA
jgi:hypothetical protein